jgi:hypothetical protein
MDIQNFPPLSIQAFELEPGDTILDYCGTQAVVVSCQFGFGFEPHERDEHAKRLARLKDSRLSVEQACREWLGGLTGVQRVMRTSIVPLSLGWPVEVIFPAGLGLTVRRAGGAR